ncbi:hypothetical protein [Streptomyces iranensis]|uniref:Multidrug efflux pump subunit AcrA (Membrane-fusion protein) n=1 Tax=Streptomyces iranensis TaxID=576784 RepID=A0ABS4N4A2_9ACTN|nr:hypothetical protein [Streptomyces iranensis]MBP2066819.1 multidrug efflux pump subunit AcrA (membrane-fusion protein) [Streptomyces iranensis]
MTDPAENHPDPNINVGLAIAAQWGEALGAEKLEIALKALEPQLKREHQARMKQLDNERALAAQQHAAAEAAASRAAEVEKAAGGRAARDAERRRNHVYRMSGLISGVVLSLALLGAGVVVAPTQPWLSACLCGPSLLALAKIFVLRRSDAEDIRASERAAREAATAVAPPRPPQGAV